MRDRLADRGVELGLARAGILLFGEQEFDHLGGARQTAGMRRENPVGATLHVISISVSRVHLGPSLGPKPTRIMVTFRRADKQGACAKWDRLPLGSGPPSTADERMDCAVSGYWPGRRRWRSATQSGRAKRR